MIYPRQPFVKFTKGGLFVKIILIKETFHSDKKQKDFYVVRYALVDDNKNIISKGEPVLWLTKDIYEALKI